MPKITVLFSGLIVLLFYACSSKLVNENELQLPFDRSNIENVDSINFHENSIFIFPKGLTPDVKSSVNELIHFNNLSEGIDYSIVHQDRKLREEYLKSFSPNEKNVFTYFETKDSDSYKKIILDKDKGSKIVLVDTIVKVGVPKQIRWKTICLYDTSFYLMTVKCSENTIEKYQDRIHYSIHKFLSQ